VLSTQSGQEGLEIFKKERPPVVLLDYRLPDVDGLVVLKQIVDFEPETYVILMTGYGSEAVIVDALRSGVVDYFAKPFDLPEIGRAVGRFTSESASDFRAILKKKFRELEKVNRELASRNFLLNKLTLFSREISGIFLFKQLMEVILEKVKEVVSPDETFFMFLDEKDRFLRPLVVKKSQSFFEKVHNRLQLFPEDIKISLTQKDNPVVKAWQSKRPIVSKNLSFLFNDLESRKKVTSVEEVLKTEEVHIFPVFSEDNLVGILVNVYNSPPALEDSQLKLRLLMNFLSQAAVTIERSRKFQRVLDESYDKLDSLYEASASLVFAADPQQMTETIISRINAVVKYDIFGMIFTFSDKDWLVLQIISPISDELIEKAKDKLIQSYETLTQRQVDRGQLSVVIKKEKFSQEQPGQFLKVSKAGSSLTAPMIVSDKIFGLVNISSLNEKAFDDRDTKFFNALVNQASMTIEGVLYENEKKYRVKLEAERDQTVRQLLMAQYVQKGLLPKNVPVLKGFEIAGCSHPSQEVGGDFYHFVPIDEKHLGVVIGDVAGKGMPAALLMAMGNTLFYEHGKNYLSPGKVLRNVDEALREQIGFKPPFYLTAFYGVLDLENNSFFYAKAGHNPPIFYKAASGRIHYLDADGPVLGVFEESQFEEVKQELKMGDLIVLYTDGVTEARNKKGQMFGLPRLERLIEDNVSLNPAQMAERISYEVRQFAEEGWLRDDVTIVVIKRPAGLKEEKGKEGFLEIEADLKNVKNIFEDISQKLNLSQKLRNSIRLAFSEALGNAIEHGAKCDSRKKIKIEYQLGEAGLKFVITDPGRGFDHRLYTVDADFLKIRGRGLFLINSIMDEVYYNDAGNQITMIKYITTGQKGGRK
jgi:sigma-B regulation protein RsbU (phosphoserine phosphatase)